MMKSKIGFALALIGVGGIAEAYGNTKQIIISLTLIGLGALLMRFDDEKDSDRSIGNVNILDRLHYLPK